MGQTQGKSNFHKNDTPMKYLNVSLILALKFFAFKIIRTEMNSKTFNTKIVVKNKKQIECTMLLLPVFSKIRGFIVKGLYIYDSKYCES